MLCMQWLLRGAELVFLGTGHCDHSGLEHRLWSLPQSGEEWPKLPVG